MPTIHFQHQIRRFHHHPKKDSMSVGGWWLNLDVVEEKEVRLFCVTFRELIGGGGMVE